MQRALQSALRQEKHALKKAERLLAEKDAFDHRRMLREKIPGYRRERRALEKDIRIKHREDWFLGPLAPRRDVGVLDDELGTVPATAFAQVEYVKNALKDIMKKANRGEDRNVFVEKDRVMVIRGPGRGTVGTIDKVRWENQTATLKSVLQVCNPSNDLLHTN
jgi:large subunit ribosomal protein L24